ncbi:hypothetical protein C9J85_02180 [Haloferax sp. wsp5]|nr:hypothetical protein C9J85_02180 [Haloferax sp. wsp5]
MWRVTASLTACPFPEPDCSTTRAPADSARSCVPSVEPPSDERVVEVDAGHDRLDVSASSSSSSSSSMCMTPSSTRRQMNAGRPQSLALLAHLSFPDSNPRSNRHYITRRKCSSYSSGRRDM